MEPATIRRRRWATDTDTIWEKISHSTAKYSKTHTHTHETHNTHSGLSMWMSSPAHSPRHGGTRSTETQAKEKAEQGNTA